MNTCKLLADNNSPIQLNGLLATLRCALTECEALIRQQDQAFFDGEFAVDRLQDAAHIFVHAIWCVECGQLPDGGEIRFAAQIVTDEGK